MIAEAENLQTTVLATSSHIELSQLGNRICILGPSSSGKSTLADAISRKQGLAAVHLDLLRHRPDTDWETRSDAEFAALHDEAVARDAWVMEGNYLATFDQRLARATGLIVLDCSSLRLLVQYLLRTVFDRERVGGLRGRRETLKFEMFHFILVATPRTRARISSLYEKAQVPKVYLRSARSIRSQFKSWALTTKSW